MSSSNITYVDDLDAKSTFVNVKVRIIKKWQQSFRLDMILIDERGKKVQAFVKKDLMMQFADLIVEDTVVFINRCGVASNEDMFPVIKSPVKLNFYKCTEVKQAHSFDGDVYGFDFFPFENINIELANNKDVLNIDVIGCVTWCGNLDIFRSARGKESKRFNFELTDLQGVVIKCTLWSDYAVEFSNYVMNNKSTEHLITILQHAKVKEFNNRVAVQTDMFGTRVFINPDIKEAQDMRRSMILKQGNPTSSSSLLSQTVYPNRLEFVLNTERKNLDEVLEAESPMDCVVVAKIALMEKEAGWYYVACRKCNKKVLTKKEYLQTLEVEHITDEIVDAPFDSYWCPKEKELATQLLPKFRVSFRVIDSTGTASFLMFDRDVSRLIGLSATDVRERQIRCNEKDTVFPHELNSLLDKKFAFKVSISKYNLDKKYSTYTVVKFCNDPDILKELVEQDHVNEVNQETEITDVSTVRIEDSSQGALSSKDAISVTGDSFGLDLENDTETSPLQKKNKQTPGVESSSKPAKRIRNLNIELDDDA